MCKCIDNCCSEDVDLLPIIKSAAVASLSAICQRPNALSILRNGGWEQTLRNEIAFKIEEHGAYIALTEAVLGRIARIDVLGRCRQCEENQFGASFAIETKTNFSGQSSQLSDAINKLARLSKQKVGTYVVYALTSLRASSDSDLARCHRLRGVSRYKRFKTENPWREPAFAWVHAHLSMNNIAGHGVPIAQNNPNHPFNGHATAQVGVWVARVEFNLPQHQCKLHWLNREDKTAAAQIWNSADRLRNKKGKLCPPKWSTPRGLTGP
jgi:hypothetical protein